MVPDHGDRCLFIFLCSRCHFFNVFPFPVCKALLIGDWYENRRGAPNTIIPAPKVMADQTQKKLLAHHAWSAFPIGAPMPPCHYNCRTDPPCAKSISAPKKNTLQVHRVLGLLYSSPNWDPPKPLNRRWVCSPFGTRGDTLACRRGVGGVPIRGDRHCGTLGYIM